MSQANIKTEILKKKILAKYEFLRENVFLDNDMKSNLMSIFHSHKNDEDLPDFDNYLSDLMEIVKLRIYHETFEIQSRFGYKLEEHSYSMQKLASQLEEHSCSIQRNSTW